MTIILSKEDKKEIFRLRTEENWTQLQLAKKFGVRQGHMSKVLEPLKNLSLPPKGQFKEYKNYLVYKDGRVWNKRRKALIKHYINKGGYPNIDVRFGRGNGGKRERWLVSRLILTVWDRPAKPGEAARHKDGVPGNTYLSNLEWGTYKENESDKKKHGTYKYGSKVYKSLLSEQQVKIIKITWQRSKGKLSGKKFCIAQGIKFKVSPGCIMNIIYNRNWKHLSSKRFYFILRNKKD